MSGNDDGIIGALAPQGEGAEPDGILRDPGVGRPAGRRALGVRFGRPRAPPKRGEFWSWLIGRVDRRAGPCPSAAASEPSAGYYIFGACSMSWAFSVENEEASLVHASAVEPSSRPTTSPAWGYINYTINDVWRLNDLVNVPGGISANVHEATAPSQFFRMTKDMLTSPGGVSMGERLRQCDGRLSSVVVVVLGVLQACVDLPRPFVLRSIKLCRRTDAGIGYIVKGHPLDSSLHRWRMEFGKRRAGKRKSGCWGKYVFGIAKKSPPRTCRASWCGSAFTPSRAGPQPGVQRGLFRSLAPQHS